MAAGLETFAKVRALHDRTDSPGEKAAAMLKMQTLARKAGMSVEQAVSTLDATEPKTQSQAQAAASAFSDFFNTPEMRADRAERERKRAAKCRDLLAEYGSEDAVWADTEREAALRHACEPLLGPGETWNTIYRLDGWHGYDPRSRMPESVRWAVTEAWPLPTTTAAAWAEYEAAEKLDSDRCAFCPDYSPHSWAEARRYILEDLCQTLPARSLSDIRGRLSWMEHVARLDMARSWEEQEPVLKTLRADIERMGVQIRQAKTSDEIRTMSGDHNPEDSQVLRSPEQGSSNAPVEGNYGSGPCSPPTRSDRVASTLPTKSGQSGPVQNGHCEDAPNLVHPRRTNADKRRDVLALVQGNVGISHTAPLTDREIARRAGVSPSTVGNIRRGR